MRKRLSRRLFVCFLLCAIATLCGCAGPKVAVQKPPVQTRAREWIDLQAGWRVRVVTPLLKSGGYVVQTKAANEIREEIDLARTNKVEVSLSASSDFIGYETSVYSVKSRRGGGVRVIFHSAETNREGQTSASHQPVEPLFRLPRQVRWVRILHLVRVSRADHNAAILGAKRLDLLDALTRQVQSDPPSCKDGRDAFCSWVPAGIAVIPESRIGAEGADQWAPM